MAPLETLALAAFIGTLFLGIFLCIHGLPGLALIAANILAYALITGFEKIAWQAALFMCLVAIAVEIGDLFYFMRGSPRFNPSRQSIMTSFAGCFLLPLLLTPSFLVIGLVGGFFLGGVFGMLCILITQESQLKPAYRIPFRVFVGRMAGLLWKGSVASTLVCFTLLLSYD
ncbi:MAG: DUF456 family protein [Syntrophales bacterium]|nr:DUF456 family protein [Syntrophales bacterium]